VLLLRRIMQRWAVSVHLRLLLVTGDEGRRSGAVELSRRRLRYVGKLGNARRRWRWNKLVRIRVRRHRVRVRRGRVEVLLVRRERLQSRAVHRRWRLAWYLTGLHVVAAIRFAEVAPSSPTSPSAQAVRSDRPVRRGCIRRLSDEAAPRDA
jgi:hypothetical protein